MISRTSYQYRFDPNISLHDVEDSLLLAVLAVESLEGRSRLKLAAKVSVNRLARSAEVSADTDVGESIARIFTGFLSKQFGDKAFRVERAVSSIEAESSDGERQTSSVDSSLQVEAL